MRPLSCCSGERQILLNGCDDVQRFSLLLRRGRPGRDAGLGCMPMPLAFCSKRSGWDVMARYFPEILRSPMHRRGDGKDVKYVPPPRNLVQDKPARVSHIIFPKYNADSETRLISVPRAEALRRLMDECLALKTRLNLGDVHRLVDALCRIDCYALTFSSLDEAVELVSDAIGQ